MDDKTLVERCSICGCQLDAPADPTSRDCGGDCLSCMALVAEDPACMGAYIEALQARIEALEADLVEWKNQHENLLSVRQQDIAAMQAKIDTLEKELAFKNEAIRLTRGCPGKIVVRNGFYKIDCYKSKHSKQALEGKSNG